MKFAIFLKSILLFNSFCCLLNKTLRLNNLKTRPAMNEKISVFVFCVEAIIYLLLYNLHDCTFKVKKFNMVSAVYLVIHVPLQKSVNISMIECRCPPWNLFTNFFISFPQMNFKNITWSINTWKSWGDLSDVIIEWFSSQNDLKMVYTKFLKANLCFQLFCENSLSAGRKR